MTTTRLPLCILLLALLLLACSSCCQSISMYLEAIPRYSCCAMEFDLEVNEKECVGVARPSWFLSTEIDLELDLDEGTTRYRFGQEGWFAPSFVLYKVTNDTNTSNHAKCVGSADCTGVFTAGWELQLPASQRRMTLQYEGIVTTDMELIYHGHTMANVSERGCCCRGQGWMVGSKELGIVDMVFVGLVFDRIMAQRHHNQASSTV